MLLGSNNQGESIKHKHITEETKHTKKDSRERHRPGVCTKARYGMSFSWPHYMTWSFAPDCTLVTVNKTYPLNIKFKKNMQSAIPDLDVMEWPCPSCWVHHPARPNGLTWYLVQRSGQGLDHFKLHNLDICPMGHQAESAICNPFSIVC
jgi:hypothetical protein